MRRWTHLHSLATGLVFGLVLDKEALVIFALGIALGAGVVFGWGRLKALLGWTREAAHGIAGAAERYREAEIERKLAAAALDRTRAENVVRTAAEQREAEKRAHFAGARDGGWLDDDDRPTKILGVETS